MIIVGKSMPIDNYEQYKRVINHWETTHAYTYKPRKKKRNYIHILFCFGVCVVIYNNLLLIHL